MRMLVERQKVNSLSVPQAREKDEREGCKRKNRRKNKTQNNIW